MKYLIVPPDAVLYDPNSVPNDGRPLHVIETVSFARAVRVVITSIVASQGMDTLDAIDLRKKVEETPVGSVLKLNDSEYNVLLPEFKRPKALSPTYALGGGEPHIRAMLEARSDPFDATAAGPVSAN